MSTEHTEDASTDTENDPYGVEVLRELLPSRLGGEGTRAAICAIRNPDANAAQIAAKTGLASTYTVGNALRSLLLGEAPDYQATANQVHERRGGIRDAESYSELTEKQQAVVDFAAKHPEFVDERTYAEVAEAIHEQEGSSVSETHVGGVLRKYREVMHQRRAQVAAEDGSEGEVEQATQDMTVREVLEAAGYDLPGENLDSMPDRGPEKPEGQATLGEAHEAEADEGEQGFQAGSEVQEAEDEDEQPQGSTFLDEGWLAQHADVPGADQAQRLPDDAEDEAVKQNTAYWAYVNGVASYGVFVSLTNPAYGDDVSGLVAEERLYGKKGHLERGQPLVVELDHRNAKGLAFTDWRLLHPDETQAQQEQEQADSEAEQDAGEGTEDEDAEQEQPDSEDGSLLEAQPDSEVLAALDERVAQQAQQMEVLANRIDTLREDAVFASEVGEFADEVEGRLDDLKRDLDGFADATNEELEQHGQRLERVEEAQSGTVEAALEEAEATSEQAHQAEQKVQALQQMVNSLAEQVQQATSTGGGLGRVQQDVQRLIGEDAALASYSYQQQDGTVTLHVQADLEQDETQDTEQVPECHECGAPLGDEWRDMNETAKQHGTQPAACPQCGGNPLPPVGGTQEDDTDE